MSNVLDVGDDVLSERTRSGDSDAFAELWRRHARAAQAAARQFQSIADPEDIVSEAYLRILRALQGGGGPREAFRPYLYRTVRNVALSWNEKSPAADELPEDLVADGPGLEETVLENTITVRAFRSLPERWQSILWYTEVEGMDPAEAAPYLGLTANSAAALAYRAREGLKKAWLQAHVSDERVPAECRWTTERMGDYRRNALTPRANRRFEDHLETCARCQIVLEEVDEVGGRLAIMLFPLVLGGAAGAGLLAELSKHATASTPSAAAVPKRGVRSGTIRTVVGVAAGVFGAAAIVTAGFALPTLLQPSATSQVVAEAKTPSAQPHHSAPAHTTTPSPAPSPTPPAAPSIPPVVAQPTTPPAPAPVTSIPVVAPVTPPPVVTTPPVVTPPPSIAPPSAPVVLSPSTGSLTNTSRPVFTGTGQPGDKVQGTYPGEPAAMTATVAANGTWHLQPASPVADGTDVFTFTQANTAGTSPAAITTVTIDTFAPPPVIQPITSPLVYLPTIAGTAEPGASVQVSAGSTPIGTATAADDGSWTLPLQEKYSHADGAVLTAVQTDPAGNTSAASAPSPLFFDRPTFVSPADGSVIPSTPGGTAVTVQLSGTPTMTVRTFLDGVTTGNTHLLGATPITASTPPLASGPHTIGVQYIDPTTGQVGSIATLTFTIGP